MKIATVHRIEAEAVDLEPAERSVGGGHVDAVGARGMGERPATLGHQAGRKQGEGMPAMDGQGVLNRAARRFLEASGGAMGSPGGKRDDGEPRERAEDKPETMHGRVVTPLSRE